jgi:hypothetical protein
LAALLGSIVIGFVFGWKRLLPSKIIAKSGKIITISIVFLLITMGLRIGMDKQTLSNLGKYGLQALFFAILTIAFSIGGVALIEKVFAKNLVIYNVNRIYIRFNIP